MKNDSLKEEVYNLKLRLYYEMIVSEQPDIEVIQQCTQQAALLEEKNIPEFNTENGAKELKKMLLAEQQAHEPNVIPLRLRRNVKFALIAAAILALFCFSVSADSLGYALDIRSLFGI